MKPPRPTSDSTKRLPSRLVTQAKRSSVSEDLERFRRGELSEPEYLQARIDRATLHLRGRVSNRKLERIRRIVTEACSSDPLLEAMKVRLLRSR